MRLPPARATVAIVAVTGLAFAAAAAAGQGPKFGIVAGFIPARVFDGMIVAQAAPVWITPLTATLVHANLLHIGFNLLMIAFCGRLVEAAIGPAGTLLLYGAGAYGAAAAQWVWAPHVMAPMIGASGAGSAVLGAYAVLYGHQRTRGWGPVSGTFLHSLWLAGAWIGLQILLGYASTSMPGVPAGTAIATAAHVGGFLVGLIAARPLLLFRYRRA